MFNQLYKIILCIIFILLSSSIFAQDIEIIGKVVDKTTKSAIPDASVTVYPSGIKLTTGANGNFSVIVSKTSGLFVQIIKMGYQPVKITENFEEIYVEMELSTKVEGQRVVVEGKRDAKRVIANRQQVDRENFKRATANAFGDSVKVIQTLPGVVTRNAFSAMMYVNGGSANEVVSYYDRLLLVNPYIWGGAISVFNPDVVQSIDFYAGGFPAEFGSAMSGVLDAKMRDGKTSSYGGNFDLSLTTLTAVLEGPIGEKGKTDDSFLIAVRRTHYDLAFDLLTKLGAVSGDFDGIQLPFFYDAHIRFKFKLNDYNVLKIYSLLVYEGLDMTYKAMNNGEESDGWKAGNELHYKNFRYLQGINLNTAFSDHVTMENTLGYSYTNGEFKYIDAANPILFKQQVNYLLYRNDLTLKPIRRNIIKLGVGIYDYIYTMDMAMINSRIPNGADLSGLPGYNKDPGTGIITIPDTSISIFKVNNSVHYESKHFFFPTAYIQDDLELINDFLFFNLGLRAEYFNITKHFIVNPRSGFKFVFKDLFTMKLAGGIYSQYLNQPFQYDEKVGNTHLAPEKSYHAMLGFEKDTHDFFFRTDGFFKYYKDLVTQENQPYNYVNGGIGYSYGFDVFAQKKIDKQWDGWISYTFVITKRKTNLWYTGDDYNKIGGGDQGDGNIPKGVWYSPSFDRRHTLNLVLNYTFSSRYQLSTTSTLQSGLPYTPVNSSQQINVTGTNPYTVYQPIWGAYDSSTMPIYLNIDVKLTMPFFWDGWNWYVQLSGIQGLFGHKNVTQYNYNKTYTERKEQKGLPFFPLLGIKGEF